ncbi:hypothetical protein FUAX_21100 [Fulvitalea axinellae]|uniref:Molecular chaperone DnaJ n=1 Tax=Fulvitalea axinellae TaxID=1182444 RepID=A0AAU9CNR6_9BACT|nr:hypothetical protein FUAX_21100 [Fulvitalea axinellae]
MKRLRVFMVAIFVLLLAGQMGVAQKKEKIDPEVSALFKTAQKQMVDGKFEEANVTFREILTKQKTLPKDLCYFFAETLYQIEQYQNSENFLNKYFDLTHGQGKFNSEARKLEKKLKRRIRRNHFCHYCNDKGYRLIACEMCDEEGFVIGNCQRCSGAGNIMCPTCKGEGVVISKASNGENSYKDCDNCKQKGFIQCSTCKGRKKTKQDCPKCYGAGFRPSEKLCEHSKNM